MGAIVKICGSACSRDLLPHTTCFPERPERHNCEPDPARHDRDALEQSSDIAEGTGAAESVAGEDDEGQDHHGAGRRVERPGAPSLGCEASAEHQTGRDEGWEADSGRQIVEYAV